MQEIISPYSIETHQNHLHRWDIFSTTWVSPTNPFTQASLPSQGWVMRHTQFTQQIAWTKQDSRKNHIKLYTFNIHTTRFFTNHIHTITNLQCNEETTYQSYNEMKKTPYQIYNEMKRHHGSWIPTSLQEMANEGCSRAPYPLPPNPKGL